MNLDNVLDNQESVQSTAAQAIASYSPSPDVFRDMWNTSFARATASHRLTLLYVANEVLHKEKQKESFAITLSLAALFPPAFRALFLDRPDLLGKLDKILRVWRQRGMLKEELLDDIQRYITPAENIEEDTPTETFRLAEEEPAGESTPLPTLVNPGEGWMLEVLDLDFSEATLREEEDLVLELLAKMETQAMDLDMNTEIWNRTALQLYQAMAARGNKKLVGFFYCFFVEKRCVFFL
jgi:hypothetical protein